MNHNVPRKLQNMRENYNRVPGFEVTKKGKQMWKCHRLTPGNHCQPNVAGALGRNSSPGAQWEPELWREVCTVYVFSADAAHGRSQSWVRVVGREWEREYSKPLKFPPSHLLAIFLFTDSSAGKESACQCRRHRRSGRSPGEAEWQSVPVFLPGNMDGEPGGLQSTGSKRVGHDWVNKHTHKHLPPEAPWKRTGMSPCRFFTKTHMSICITVHLCSRYYFKRKESWSHCQKACV